MKVVDPGFEVIDFPDGDLAIRKLERAARLCYKSDKAETVEEAAQWLKKKIVQSGHHSVLEHCSASVQFVFDRGVSHEIVRHRIASFSQESTRYCNYSKEKHNGEVTFIRPSFWEVKGGDSEEVRRKKERMRMEWYSAMRGAEGIYLEMLEDKQATPQEARSVLPNSLKTEILVTANFREWRTIFSQRTAKAAHPQMREVMLPLLADFRSRVPVVFDDVGTTEW